MTCGEQIDLCLFQKRSETLTYPGFELESPIPFPTTITVTLIRYIFLCVFDVVDVFVFIIDITKHFFLIDVLLPILPSVGTYFAA